jgi:hypothetical protein
MCALFVGVTVTGCALIDAEKNNRGGFLDEIADDHWMKADSKKMRALRAITLEASLARIAMIAPKSAPDRALLARRIGETTKRADVVRRCAFQEIQVSGQLSSEPCFFFDSVMVDYENALFDLALIALPIDEAKTLITRVTGGIASVTVNPLELVQTLLNIGREAFRYGRVVGAIYRDTLELEVQVWLASPRQTRGLAIVTDETVAGLAAVYVRGNDNIPAWRAEIAALRAQGLEPIPDPRFFSQLYTIIAYICGQIVTKEDPAYRECAQPDLTQKIPLMNASTGGGLVLSGIVGGGTAGTSALTQQVREADQKQRILQSKVDALEKLVNTRERRALNDLERNMPADELKIYKRALCVVGEDATTDVFDDQTREGLRQFAGGITWKSPPERSPPLTAGARQDLKKAAQFFPDCTGSVVNAYELGVYSRSNTALVGISTVDKVLSQAVVNLALNGGQGLTGRAAIARLRDHFLQQAPVPSGNAKDALDGALWPLIQIRGTAPVPMFPGSGAKK